MRNKIVPMACCKVQNAWPWDIIDPLNRKINTRLCHDRGRGALTNCATCAEFADAPLGFLREMSLAIAPFSAMRLPAVFRDKDWLATRSGRILPAVLHRQGRQLVRQ